MSFVDFWTNENNPKLPQSEYLYGTKHIVMLIFVALFLITFIILFCKKSDKAKWLLLKVFAYIFIFFEIVSRIINLILLDSFSLSSIARIILPMHICSVAVWIIIFAIFSKNKTLINYASILGILATSAFLLYPGVGINYKYISFTNLYSIISHCLGFITSILFIVFKFTDFKIKHIWKTILAFIIMFLWGVIVDFIIFPGSNYMYLIEDPLSLNIGFPYQILYSILIILYISLFYFIQYICVYIKNKKQITDN